MTLYSDKAVEAMEDALHGQLGEPQNEEAHADLAAFLLDVAHDPELGRDASINVGVMLDWLRDASGDLSDEWGLRFADWLEREHREGRLG